MRLVLLIFLASLVSQNVVGETIVTCEDIDPVACQSMAQQNANMCQDPTLSRQICPKHCNKCPLVCYSGETSIDPRTNVIDFRQSNTISCNTGEICRLKPHGTGIGSYIAECSDQQQCTHYDICCNSSLCNTPKALTTLPPPPTTTPKPTTTTVKQVTCPGVGFSAGIANNRTILKHAEVVIFDHMYTDVGSGYNARTGVFISPVAGIFVFEVTTLAERNKYSYLDLYHNSNYILSVYGHKSGCDYGSGANAIILDIQKGDRVYVKARDSSLYGDIDINIYGRTSEIYSIFSGYLVHSPTCGN
ncbi:hypothetical protein ACF0H5_023885 [Mactra antiquata]